MKINLRVYILATFLLVTHLAACEAPPLDAVGRPKEKPVLAGRAFAYDGDSVFFGSVEVRLDAIDAPERDQACRDAARRFWPCGIAARDRLRALIGRGQVTCVISGRDRYKRLLGICYAHSEDLNAAMVKEGYAVAYRHFSLKYAAGEEAARARRLGIWQDPDFTEPFYCRHFEAGHTCYEYDFGRGTGRVAATPLIGKFHVSGAPG